MPLCVLVLGVLVCILRGPLARDAGPALLRDDRLDVSGARGPGVLVVTSLAQLDGVGEQ